MIEWILDEGVGMVGQPETTSIRPSKGGLSSTEGVIVGLAILAITIGLFWGTLSSPGK